MQATSRVLYEEEVWNYVYLSFDSGLNEEDRGRITWNIVDMYKKGKQKRNIKGENFEGQVKMGKYRSLGSFSGVEFTAEMETERGKSELSILLLDKINPHMN